MLILEDIFMHRTQLLLENWQYEALKTRARREGKTLSQWVRQVLQAALAPATASKRGKKSKSIFDICGIGRDPGRFSGADHDRVLYGWQKKR